MAKHPIRVELNQSGVRELLRSDKMEELLRERAQSVASRLGDGYSVNTRKGKNRANAEITADTAEARRENMENNTILKALR